jgi:hypothetical protein
MKWTPRSLSADFVLDSGRALRVRFDRQTIVRVLDELALSTEQGTKTGLVPRHFAYRVEGSPFADAQSETWKLANNPVFHHQFITGWGCLDVLSNAVPTFEVVDTND